MKSIYCSFQLRVNIYEKFGENSIARRKNSTPQDFEQVSVISQSDSSFRNYSGTFVFEKVSRIHESSLLK